MRVNFPTPVETRLLTRRCFLRPLGLGSVKTLSVRTFSTHDLIPPPVYPVYETRRKVLPFSYDGSFECSLYTGYPYGPDFTSYLTRHLPSSLSLVLRIPVDVLLTLLPSSFRPKPSLPSVLVSLGLLAKSVTLSRRGEIKGPTRDLRPSFQLT